MHDPWFAPWRALALVVVITAATWSAAPSPRAPQFEIASKSQWSELGELVAADGPHVIAADRSRDDPKRMVLRIWTVTATGALEETGYTWERDDQLIDLDISGDRIVAHGYHPARLVFYELRRGRWTHVQTLPLAGACREYAGHVALSGDVLVHGAKDTLCVYEHRRGAWEQVAQIPGDNDSPRALTNGDRIAFALHDGSELRLWRRTGTTWSFEQAIAPPPGRETLNVDLSSRWLAVTYVDDETWEHPAVHIFAVGAAVVPITVLRPHRDDRYFGWMLRLSERYLVCSGKTHQVFEATLGGWRTHGELSVIDPEARDVTAVGDDHAWVGESGGYGGPPGMLFGYRL